MKKVLLFTVVAVICYFLIDGCKKCTPLMTTKTHCDSISHTYSGDVDTIIMSKCSSSIACHATGAVSGIPLTNYTEIADNIAEIETSIKTGIMPKAGFPQLTDEEKSTIFCWIDSGYPND